MPTMNPADLLDLDPPFGLAYPTYQPGGAWWDWSGVKSILGDINAAIASNLDNLSTTADLVRVQADGDDAQAEAQGWAEGNGYVVADITALMASDPKTGRRVRRAVNTLAAAYLVEHREWYDAATLSTDAQRALSGLRKRAAEQLTKLFGTEPEGLLQPGGDEVEEVSTAPVGLRQTVDSDGRPVGVAARRWEPYWDANLEVWR
jgi:hypothetical protein